MLSQYIDDEQIREVVESIVKSASNIAHELRHHHVVESGDVNDFGDKVLSVDLASDEIISNELKSCEHVYGIASEEFPELQVTNTNGKFIVCYDPLDGSSIVNCNWSVGSIFGVWKRDGTDIIGCSGANQVASVMIVFGPRLSCVFSTGAGSFISDINITDGSLIHISKVLIEPQAKIFSPANLRVCNEVGPYLDFVLACIGSRMTLRYTGGLVPDIYQQFVKGNGVFVNPTSEKSPPKLRVLYEVFPIAMLVEQAGGMAICKDGRVLDLCISGYDQRSDLICGSKDTVNSIDFC